MRDTVELQFEIDRRGLERTERLIGDTCRLHGAARPIRALLLPIARYLGRFPVVMGTEQRTEPGRACLGYRPARWLVVLAWLGRTLGRERPAA